MQPWNVVVALLVRLRRIFALTTLAGVVPLLVTGCFRSLSVIDHVEVKQHTDVAMWEVQTGSGHGNVYVEWSYGPSLADSPGPEEPNFLVWHDYGPFDAPEGPHLIWWSTGNRWDPGYHRFTLMVGYPTLIVIAGVLVGWRVRRLQCVRVRSYPAERPPPPRKRSAAYCGPY